MEYVISIIASLVVGALAAGGVYFYMTNRSTSAVLLARQDAERIVEEAESRRREMVLEAKDEAIRLRNELDREQQQRRKEVDRQERRIQQKEEQLDKRHELLDRRERKIQHGERELEQARSSVDALLTERQQELERVAQLTQEERDEIAAASVALDLARLVYAAREARGLTQTEAAELTGVRQQMISRLEGGTAQPTFKTVERYLRRLGFALHLSLVDERNDETVDCLILNEEGRSTSDTATQSGPVLVNHQ
jgi:ribonucrease Y